AWHYNHMIDPSSMTPGSIMPSYDWLAMQEIDTTSTASKINALRKIGVPYAEGYENIANRDLMEQAESITAGLKADNIEVSPTSEMVAIIAYLQRLGVDIKAEKKN